jgi:hypothetical protein
MPADDVYGNIVSCIGTIHTVFSGQKNPIIENTQNFIKYIGSGIRLDLYLKRENSEKIYIELTVFIYETYPLKIYYYLSGNALFIPAIKESIPLNYVEAIKSRQKPRYVKNKGFTYQDNSVNRLNLYTIFECLKGFSNKKIILYRPEIFSNYGQIGTDIRYDEKEWVINIIGKTTKIDWDPENNPIIKLSMGNEIIEWNKCSIRESVVIDIVKKLQSFYTDKRFDKMFEKPLSLIVWHPKYRNPASKERISKLNEEAEENFRNELKEFIKSDKITAYIGWSQHARTIYKDVDKKKAWIIDPWKSELSKREKGWKIIKDVIKNETDYSIEFKSREPEQGAEGSCVSFGILRAIMIIYEGIERGVNMRYNNGSNPIFLDYVILTYRLISIYRKFAKKRG